MRRVLVTLGLLMAAIATANAADCPGNPDALGVSRTLVVDPTDHARLGIMQYPESLPLKDHEVVLTFDDGPLPPYSTRVLDTLASECVKATYFLVGRMARGYPDLVRRIAAEGHTIGTHSQDHPFTFARMPADKVAQQIEDGIASAGAALGGTDKVAPFFRIPGLLRGPTVESYASAHGLMIWSADFPADDWTHIKAAEITRRAISRLEQHGRGILLLHDIQPATALALPEILREIKARGFKVVHVVPASAGNPATPTEPQQWVMRGGASKLWAGVPITIGGPQPVLAAPGPASFGFEPPFTTKAAIALIAPHRHLASHLAKTRTVPLPPVPIWPRLTETLPSSAGSASLPAPDANAFGYAEWIEHKAAALPVPISLRSSIDPLGEGRRARMMPASLAPRADARPMPGSWPLATVGTRAH